MKTNRQRRIAAVAVLGLAVLASASQAGAADATGDVQRQLQLREQQQMELRLRMQQQLDRSTRPPQTPSADLQMRGLERDQQQRLQQFYDQQTRGRIGSAVPATAEQMRQDFERQRALGAGATQLNGFGTERQFESTDRSAP